MKKNIACIILAAGKGVRMKSKTAKVMHPLCGRPMLAYVLDLVKARGIKNKVVVLGHQYAEVKKILPSGVKTVLQKKLLGTADALKQALGALKSFRGDILVLYGDIPLLTQKTIFDLVKFHQKNNPAATILTANAEKPEGYGRILRDKYSSISGIIEEKDADDFQKNIKEINTGIIVFAKEKLEAALRQVRANNRKKEYYLTDCIGILYKKNELVESVKAADLKEVMGINSRQDLAQANRIMQKRINEKFLKSGVTMIDPDTAFIDYGTKIGADTTIYPFTVIGNNVTIGKRCSVGPFAHLRDGTRLQDDTCIGNFVEIARSKVGARTLAKHFCYLGDARLGSAVNIGAGVVTANFDGRKKYITQIKDRAFIGSDTVLVAPVEVGKNAATGAGSVVLSRRNIPGGTAVAGVPARPIKRKRA